MRSDARSHQADRRQASRRHGHQRRAIPAAIRGWRAPAHPRREWQPHADEGDRRLAPPERAVGVRGRQERHRDELVHADLQRRGARQGDDGGREELASSPAAAVSPARPRA